MFRDLIPRLESDFHIIAPDLIGFGYSAHPSVVDFQYTFDNLASITEDLLLRTLGLKRFSVYVQDYGAPVGFRIASRNPDVIEALVIQNGNAYREGLSGGWAPIQALWAKRNAETEKGVRALLTLETTKFQYVHGVKDPARISPDSYTFDQMFLDRPGNDQIQIELFHNYASNLDLYPKWQAYFRSHRPPTLIVWGRNDPFFTEDGATAFKQDLPNAELHLLETGHFALEDHSDVIANHIRRFLVTARKQGTAA
jgi:pimeloyl-ACP methyl ester carboxylesterase